MFAKAIAFKHFYFSIGKLDLFGIKIVKFLEFFAKLAIAQVLFVSCFVMGIIPKLEETVSQNVGLGLC